MQMKSSSKGMSLVEMAVVVLLTGLLITAALYGLRAAENAKVKAFIGQMTIYKAAAESFKKQYGTWPGDFSQAQQRINGCNAAQTQCANGNGDHIIASSAGGTGCRMPAFNGGGSDQPFPCVPAANTTIANGNETLQFWRHLALTGYIEGLRMRPNRFAWGDSMPKVKLAGGMHLIYNGDLTNNYTQNTGVAPVTPALTGHFFLLGRNPRLFNRNFDAVGDGVLDAATAWQVDRELDDGFPNTGVVRGRGGWGCGNPASSAAQNRYGDGGDQNRQCMILYRFAQ